MHARGPQRVDGRFELGDRETVLSRVVPREGRSRAYLDGRPVTAAELTELGTSLVDLVTRALGLGSHNWLGDPQLALISVIAYHLEGVRAKGLLGYLKSWLPPANAGTK